jgi:hypothetical protein
MRFIRVCIRCEGVLVALDDGALLDKGVPDDPFCEVVDLFAERVEASNLLVDGTGCPLALLVEGLDLEGLGSEDVGGLSRVCWVLRLG